MRKQFLNTLLITILGIALFACGGNDNTNEGNDTTDVNTDTQTLSADSRKMVKAYLELKDALVASDANQARISAKKLSGRAGDAIRGTANSLYDTDDLKKQRELFSTISVSLYDQLKANGKSPITLYKQFCPMAFDNKGAFWLSEEEAIKNPYFGDDMLNCGEVKETLAVN